MSVLVCAELNQLQSLSYLAAMSQTSDVLQKQFREMLHQLCLDLIRSVNTSVQIKKDFWFGYSKVIFNFSVIQYVMSLFFTKIAAR